MQQKVEFNLSDEDVRRDLFSIVQNMQRIRNETISVEDIPDAQKDEYLHLTHRLASCIHATASQRVVDDMDKLGKMLARDPSLMQYDPLQYAYFHRNKPKFTETLEDLTISVFGDTFCSLEQAHHVVQVIKYFGAMSESEKEKIRILDSIAPFNGPILEEQKPSRLGDILNAVLGYNFDLKTVDKLTAKADGNIKFLQEMIREARERGFTNLQCDLYAGEVADLERKISLPGKRVVQIKKTLNPNKMDFATFLRHSVSRFIQYGAPLTYPITGNLYGKFVRMLEGYTERPGFQYDSRHAFISSATINSILGPAAAITSIILSANHIVPNWVGYTGGFGGAYLLAESLIRIGCAKDWNSRQTTKEAGSPLMFLPMMVPYLAFKPLNTIAELFRNRRLHKGDLATLEFKVKEDAKKPKTDFEKSDVFGKYERAAALSFDIPPEIEGNLVLDTQNHHQFGKKFDAYLRGKSDLGLGEIPEYDRVNRAVVYSTSSEVDGYRKENYLICAKDRRFVLSVIGKGKKQSNLIALASGIQTAEDAAKMVNTVYSNGGNYVHLAYIKNGELVANIDQQQK